MKQPTTSKQCRSLQEFCDCIPHGNYKHARRWIIQNCCITEQTFMNWERGRTTPPAHARDKIAAYARTIGYTINFEPKTTNLNTNIKH